MLNSDYEKSYISAFTKLFTILKDEYELYIKQGNLENYEIEVKKINNEKINEYLSICFQKQNGSFTVIFENKISTNIIDKVIKDISYAINENYIASYNFKDLKNYIVYHFEYVKENKIIDNKRIIKDFKNLGKIENVKYNIISDIIHNENKKFH